jgi:hypothetical protein
VNWRFLLSESSLTDNQYIKRMTGDWTRAEPSVGRFVEVAMSEAVRVGLAVTSTDTVRTAEAGFSNVDIIGNVSHSGPFTESKDISLLTIVSPSEKSR